MKKSYDPEELIDSVKALYEKLKLRKGWRSITTTIGLGYVKKQAVDFLNTLYDILNVEWIDTKHVWISPDVYDELKRYMHPYLHEIIPRYSLDLDYDEIEFELENE